MPYRGMHVIQSNNRSERKEWLDNLVVFSSSASHTETKHSQRPLRVTNVCKRLFFLDLKDIIYGSREAIVNEFINGKSPKLCIFR